MYILQFTHDFCSYVCTFIVIINLRLLFLLISKTIKEGGSFYKYQYLIQFNSTNIRLQGGGKKRKKKTFTKPKKNKHLKKKLKLRFLHYYLVEEGKVQKLRKDSPDSLGCFMAEHHDRITCGKTGLTYTRN
nr:40S ribosomal protein S27A [Cryptomonas sp.]